MKADRRKKGAVPVTKLLNIDERDKKDNNQPKIPVIIENNELYKKSSIGKKKTTTRNTKTEKLKVHTCFPFALSNFLRLLFAFPPFH